jgi:hypothetical protein
MLQAGMHFRPAGKTSIVLMSLRHNAPYADRIEDNGRTIIYEGHDAKRCDDCPDPKKIDQPERTPKGTETQNGYFHEAAQQHKKKGFPAEFVHVYQKLYAGIWSYNGTFQLTDSWQEQSGSRKVFKFKLELMNEGQEQRNYTLSLTHDRVIPAEVKRAVYKRDNGCCVKCGATKNLHFDHILPFSKGGASITEANVQLLCARHNLQKSDKIE